MKQLPKTCVRKGHVAGGKIKKEKIVIKNVKKNKLKKIEKKQVLLKVGNGKMKKLNKTVSLYRTLQGISDTCMFNCRVKQQ